jgi:hypothetical protein
VDNSEANTKINFSVISIQNCDELEKEQLFFALCFQNAVYILNNPWPGIGIIRAGCEIQ